MVVGGSAVHQGLSYGAVRFLQCFLPGLLSLFLPGRFGLFFFLCNLFVCIGQVSNKRVKSLVPRIGVYQLVLFKHKIVGGRLFVVDVCIINAIGLIGFSVFFILQVGKRGLFFIAPQKLLFARGAREPFFKMPKMTLAAFIPLEGSVHPLLAVNIHAINFTGLKPFAQNLQRALQLLQNYPGPVLLGGDFNAWSAKRRQLLQEVVKTAGLTEVSFEPDVRTHCLGLPVDYLFVRGLTVRTASVRETLGSDHNPLLARLEVC